VEEAASRHGVRILHVEDINSPETVAWLTSIRPKMMVSVAASQIFRSEVLEIPELGCINLHSSPLPKYRGMMPNFWAMWHGDTRTCVTVHRMVPKLDAGEIILQKEVPIHPHDTLHDLMQRSKVIGGQALVEAAEIITAGIAQPRPLNLEEGSYFHFPTRGDAKKLRKLGHRLI
jgi:methionyl-tRNA formyltransferase